MDEKKIELTLDAEIVNDEEKKKAEEALKAAVGQKKLDDALLVQNYLKDAQLTPEEQQTVDDFAAKIDVADSAIVLKYGAACQEKMTQLSDTILKDVKGKDLGDVGNMITDLVTELEGFDAKESKGFLGLFKKPARSLAQLKNRYSDTEANVSKIVDVLGDHQNRLSKDAVTLDELYGSNLNYFKELTMYIMAGKKAVEDARNGKLAELEQRAKETDLAEDAQAANDYAAAVNRFEKKLHDLELTRTISMQMAPQIRLIQNNDILMVERIQSTINNTIPLWKNQMVLALGMAHSQEAMEAQKKVTDLTNEMLKKNAETLHMGTVGIARESERSIVDAETLKASNEELIASLKEVIQIQEDGRAKRLQAENELIHIEAQLKETLLDIRNKAAEKGTVNDEQ